LLYFDCWLFRRVDATDASGMFNTQHRLIICLFDALFLDLWLFLSFLGVLLHESNTVLLFFAAVSAENVFWQYFEEFLICLLYVPTKSPLHFFATHEKFKVSLCFEQVKAGINLDCPQGILVVSLFNHVNITKELASTDAAQRNVLVLTYSTFHYCWQMLSFFWRQKTLSFIVNFLASSQQGDLFFKAILFFLFV